MKREPVSAGPGNSRVPIKPLRELNESEIMFRDEERYRALFQESRDPIYITARDGSLDEVNPSFLSLFGYRKEEIKDLNVLQLYVDPEQRSRFQERIEKKESLRDYEVKLLKKNGAKIDCLITASLRTDGSGNILGYHGIIRDITDLKRVYDTVRRSEERFRRLVENANDPIYTHDLTGNLTWVNQETTRIYGYSKEELLKLNVAHIVDPEYLPLIRTKIQESTDFFSKTEPYEILTYGKNGKPVWVEVSTRLLEKEGQTVEVLNIVRDITKQKQVKEKLLAYQDLLRSLASDRSLTEERERRRIAVELHDRVGQLIVIAKIKLGIVRESISSLALGGKLSEVGKLIDQAIQNTRSLTYELSPPILHELGFEASVQWLCKDAEERYGISTYFENDVSTKPLSDNIRIVLFTAVRELLVNVMKHAKALRVGVSIQKDNDTICVKVEDDGVGFDMSEMDFHVTRKGGFGLFSIRERLAHLGGRVDVDSIPGTGTRVSLFAPLKR